MLEALALATALHTNTPQPTPTEVRNASATVDLRQPDEGAYSKLIVDAAHMPKKHRAFAKCVLRHETGAVLHNKDSREDAKNPISSASGRWQFLDNSWRHGGSHMVRERLRDFDVPKKEAKRIRKHLAATPIRKWDGWFQDVLAVEVIERGGHHHWTGTGCGHGT